MMMKRRGILEWGDVVSAHGEILDSIARLIHTELLSSEECFVRFSECWLSGDVSELRILDQEGTALP